MYKQVRTRIKNVRGKTKVFSIRVSVHQGSLFEGDVILVGKS